MTLYFLKQLTIRMKLVFSNLKIKKLNTAKVNFFLVYTEEQIKNSQGTFMLDFIVDILALPS